MHRLHAVAALIASVLAFKIFLSILYQYQWYFPADFHSEFLSGRQEIFRGVYRAAFYAHIISAPLMLIGGVFLLMSAQRMLLVKDLRWAAIHRWTGRVQAVVVLLVVVPSSLVMASQAFAGAISGLGLASLSVATAACVILAVNHVRRGQIQLHKRWATRCCILLCSALLLRLMSGVVSVMELEPIACYRVNVWLCWLVPLGGYELWRHYAAHSIYISLSRPKGEAME